MRSLRGRLLLGTVLATAAVFVVAGAILYAMLRNALIAEFDIALTARAQALANLVEQDEHGVKMDAPSTLPSTGDTEPSEDHFAVWDQDGRLIAQSAWRGPADGLAALRQYALHGRISFTIRQAGRRGRTIGLLFTPQQEDELAAAPHATPHQAYLVLTRDTRVLDRRLARLGWLLAGVFSLAMIVSAAGMAWVVRRGLSPLNALADRIHAIGATDLSERIDMCQAPREITPVLVRLNELLDHVQAVIARERTFTADVAHELRTPLAGLRTALEVSCSRPRGPQEYEQMIRKCLKAVCGMHAMVENLLMVARVDANQLQPQYEPVDLVQVLQEAWLPFQDPATQRDLTVGTAVQDHLVVESDRGLLRIVIRNLFDNAVSYADSGGTINIEGEQAGDQVLLRISNTGSQVSAEQATDVFERFWRGDTARSESGRHCGLGLALCRRIATLLGGTMAVDTAFGGVFRVTLALPATRGR